MVQKLIVIEHQRMQTGKLNKSALNSSVNLSSCHALT